MMAAGDGKGKDGKKVESPCKREDRCSAWGAKEERKEGERKERGESPPPPPGMHMCVRVREKGVGRNLLPFMRAHQRTRKKEEGR